MFCSCKIFTDKCNVRSLCSSRASCRDVHVIEHKMCLFYLFQAIIYSSICAFVYLSDFSMHLHLITLHIFTLNARTFMICKQNAEKAYLELWCNYATWTTPVGKEVKKNDFVLQCTHSFSKFCLQKPQFVNVIYIKVTKLMYRYSKSFCTRISPACNEILTGSIICRSMCYLFAR